MANPKGERIDHSPVTLKGDEGVQVAHNLRQLMLGNITLDEAGPAFGLSESSGYKLTVDEETIQALGGIGLGMQGTEAQPTDVPEDYWDQPGMKGA